MSISSRKSQKKGEVEGKVRERKEVWVFIGGRVRVGLRVGVRASVCVCVIFLSQAFIVPQAPRGLWRLMRPWTLFAWIDPQSPGIHRWLSFVAWRQACFIDCLHTPTTWYWIGFRHMHCDEQNCHMFCTFAIACQANKSLWSKVLPSVDFQGY